MTTRKREASKVFSLADGKLLESQQKPSKSRRRRAGKKKTKGASWQHLALLCLSLLLLTTSGLALYAFHLVGELRQQTAQTMVRMERKMQAVDASIQFDSKRQQLLLGIRDAILEANPRVSLNDAYGYAEMILQASEKYPALEPLTLYAIALVESGFRADAVSHADARGLFQIWPSTGRMLTRVLGWEYNDKMLFDPEKNTELAALYLDILFAAYNDERLVLAEYNGGPLNAGYYRAGSRRAAAETRQYVAKVLDARDSLRATLAKGRDFRLEPMHRDGTRADKQLGGRSPGDDQVHQAIEAGN